MREFVAHTKNGYDVYAELEESHLATHIKDVPELLGLVKEILRQSEPELSDVRFETDMGRFVGAMDLVETNEGDEIFYAKRPNRNKYTRFVKGKDPVPTTYVTIGLIKTHGSDKEYDVYTAYLGRVTPSFPSKGAGSKLEREFWAHHALAWGTQEIVPGSETSACPW